MKNIYENILKTLFIALLILIAVITAKAQKSGEDFIVAINGQTYIVCADRNYATFQSISIMNERFVYGEIHRLATGYNGTAKEQWELINKDIYLSTLSFPCFVEEIQAKETPASKAYYEQCRSFAQFIKTL